MPSAAASRTLSDMRRWHTCNVAGDGSSANLENGDDESARKARRQQFLRETQADEAREPRAAGNAPTQGEEMVNVEDNEVYQDTCPVVTPSQHPADKKLQARERHIKLGH